MLEWTLERSRRVRNLMSKTNRITVLPRSIADCHNLIIAKMRLLSYRSDAWPYSELSVGMDI